MQETTNNPQGGEGNVAVNTPNTVTPPVENRPASTATTGGSAPEPSAEAKKAGTSPAKEKVQVDKDVLERLLNRVDDLEAAADIGRLSRIQSLRSQGKLIKTAKLGVYDKKIVLGWATVKDDVYTDEKGVIHEDQQIQLKLDDVDVEGNRIVTDSEPMSYRTFARLITRVTGEVIKESTDQDGHRTMTVKLDDGREHELSVVFINP